MISQSKIEATSGIMEKETDIDPSKWVEKYADYLLSVAMLRVGRMEDAEDLVQEVFLAGYRNREQFRGHASEKTWLSSILSHKVMDFYRRQKPEKSFSGYLEESQLSFDQHFFDQSNFGHWLHDIGPNYLSNQADARVLSAEFQKAIEFCLSKMPARLKSVFMARYFDETESNEICREFDISDKNFWVIIFRAKTIFRKCLANNEML